MGRPRTLLVALAASAALAGLVAPPAGASWKIKGHGFGHGVGMSQYGAYGYAQHGWGYRKILGHYYRHTKMSRTKTRDVRVLIGSGTSSVGFSGASKACGKKVRPSRSYSFTLSGGKVRLRSSGGEQLAKCGREGDARGGDSVVVGGTAYRGTFLARRVDRSLLAINKVSIDDYVKGVVPNEMPASWDADALKTQAVAARSFALATTVNGDGYDLFDDTRSQVYGGLTSEQPSTNRAVRATSRKVLKYKRKVIVAYFSSTSGGETENVEFGFPGSPPVPYLKAADDPFDKISPFHKWKLRRSDGFMSSRLQGLFQGKLRRIKILETGRSPRIVKAKVVGSRGSTKVSGPTLQGRLQLRSTWAKFEKR